METQTTTSNRATEDPEMYPIKFPNPLEPSENPLLYLIFCLTGAYSGIARGPVYFSFEIRVERI